MASKSEPKAGVIESAFAALFTTMDSDRVSRFRVILVVAVVVCLVLVLHGLR